MTPEMMPLNSRRQLENILEDELLLDITNGSSAERRNLFHDEWDDEFTETRDG